MEKKLGRREARENAFLAVFSATFKDMELSELIAEQKEETEHPIDAFGEKLLRACAAHAEEIDATIEPRLKGWTLSRIPRVSLAALRLAVAELLYGGENQPSVVINEAVELVKRYGGDEDYQFVNGLLGSVVRELGLVDEKPSAASETPEKVEE